MAIAGLSCNRVLLLNWRDTTHPLAGGAEKYCWEVATGLVAMGATVALFTASTPGLPGQEVRQGVAVHRRGHTFSVYLWAALFLLQNRRSFDAVVDCQNGIPFFAPICLLGRPTSVVLLIHHVHRDQFATRFRWPLRILGVVLEGPVSRLVYGQGPIITVSPFTRAEVRRRLRLKGPIFVVPNGVAPELPAALPHRSEQPRLIYVGRLVSYKRLPLLLAAVAELRRRGTQVTLDIVGSGPMRACLEEEVLRRDLIGAVRFWGRVTDEQRALLLAAAWLLVTPSAGEGWGLTVIEANAVGRPALAFRVPGLADSIVPGTNGWLVDREDGLHSALQAALTELAQPVQQQRFAASCRAWARRFSWTRTAERVADVVEEASNQRRAVRRASALRRASDVATVIRLEISDGLDALLQQFPCDLWSLDGSTLQVLLQGRDMEAAAAYLEDLGLSGRAEARVALVVDLLFGPGAARDLEPTAEIAAAGRLHVPPAGNDARLPGDQPGVAAAVAAAAVTADSPRGGLQ